MFDIKGIHTYTHTHTHDTQGTSLVAQMVKNLPAMQEAWVLTLGLEDPPEKGMAILSSIPAWSILWTEQPGQLQSKGSQRSRHINKQLTHTHTHTHTHTLPKINI